MLEVKDISGFEGQYTISIDGTVISLSRIVKARNCERRSKERVLRPYIQNRGYMTVILTLNDKQFHKSIHRLIAEHFIPNPGNLPIVNHIDGNKLNNEVHNLEWVTGEENMQHAFKLGLVNRKKAV